MTYIISTDDGTLFKLICRDDGWVELMLGDERLCLVDRTQHHPEQVGNALRILSKRLMSIKGEEELDDEDN